MPIFASPSSARSRWRRLADHETFIMEWGRPEAPPVVCWHALARTGRDFDPLAAVLAQAGYRVIVPDTIGRGLSAWARHEEEYGFATYEAIAEALINQPGCDQVRWIGTSMGGALGVRLAAGRLKNRITHLLVNDIGPELPAAAVDRIEGYVGRPPVFDGVRGLEAYLREVYVPFGPQTDEQWARMTASSVRRLPNGQVTLHYDPRVVAQFSRHPHDYTIWDRWDAVRCRTLLLRGASSDLLTEDIAAQMLRRGPRPRLIVDPECGHAPALNRPFHFGLVLEFLAS